MLRGLRSSCIPLTMNTMRTQLLEPILLGGIVNPGSRQGKYTIKQEYLLRPESQKVLKE